MKIKRQLELFDSLTSLSLDNLIRLKKSLREDLNKTDREDVLVLLDIAIESKNKSC